MTIFIRRIKTNLETVPKMIKFLFVNNFFWLIDLIEVLINAMHSGRSGFLKD